MALTYNTFVAALANLTVIPSTDPNFATNLPSCIDYGEQRIYRELDLLSTVVRDASGSTTSNSRNFTLPQALGRFVRVDGINVVTPASTAPDSGTRTPLVPVSRDCIDALWPVSAAAGAGATPKQFAMVTDQIIVMGPAPGAAYTLEVIGTVRPAPLSATNTSTCLTLYLPDLFLAACMVQMSGYMRNFGAQADQPAQAQSWEGQYNLLMQSADKEEARKRFAGASWTNARVEQSAMPQRG